ncbi:hypothetical protein QQ045_030980 [Rhodiola kirilowii]
MKWLIFVIVGVAATVLTTPVERNMAIIGAKDFSGLPKHCLHISLQRILCFRYTLKRDKGLHSNKYWKMDTSS